MLTQLSLGIQSQTEERDQFRGAFLGAAIGDAMGFVTEFMRSPKDIKSSFNVDRLTQLMPWERRTRYQGKYPIKVPLLAGTYSDDTQLTLASARSIRSDGSFDIEAFSRFELPLWLNYELGGGVSTKLAARNLTRKDTLWHNNFYEESYSQYLSSGGNGAAMRVLPIALANARKPEQRYQDIWRNTIVTHGHTRALVGALLIADAIVTLLDHPREKGKWADELTRRCIEDYPQLPAMWSEVSEFGVWRSEWEARSKRSFIETLSSTCTETADLLAIIRASHKKGDSIQSTLASLGCYDRHTKGSGNGTVVAAIYFLLRSTTVDEAILKVANEIGIDTDTIGYFVGGMLGCYYGLQKLPLDMRSTVLDGDYLTSLADWCCDVFQGKAQYEARFQYPPHGAASIPSRRNSLINETEDTGSRIEFPVLGQGTIAHQEDLTPSWRGKHIYLLRILLDIGQTIFLQVDGLRPREPFVQIETIQQQGPASSREKHILDSISILDEFKTRVENSRFRSDVIVQAMREIKFVRQDRALYNAFSTWLWAALPDRLFDADVDNETGLEINTG